ncbi:hypothetical protein M0R45_015603 [Rubus argutus]|uniref:Secreted protein n=1 Tax=Rubus argutus TaxID=59490 RepID=A0AAW1XQQ3_RUBAR
MSTNTALLVVVWECQRRRLGTRMSGLVKLMVASQLLCAAATSIGCSRWNGRLILMIPDRGARLELRGKWKHGLVQLGALNCNCGFED